MHHDPTLLMPTADHLHDCAAARSPFHRMRGMVEATDAFLRPRMVSLLLLIVLGATAVLLLLD